MRKPPAAGIGYTILLWGQQTSMQTMTRAARAYEACVLDRSLSEQEADVFRRATGALKPGTRSGLMPRVRAIADNRGLWLTVKDLHARCVECPAGRFVPRLSRSASPCSANKS